MERRLAEFRAAQRRAALAGEGVCAKEHQDMGLPGIQPVDDSGPGPPQVEKRSIAPRLEELPVLHRGPAEDGSSNHQLQSCRSLLTKPLLLKFLLWLVLLGLFVELEFGLVYFVLSMFYWIYEGTRGPGEKKSGEKSAYSVFNPGCESIQGTLTAEQLERELQYRPLLGL
ncbi:SAYSvFN domain-containing protein 1 [Ambystoma mexicanum]|uniref:SAYSvFN domain-containing protein 1 n=1 Tax=Ambystoma mexicanum TaxID=8296 RepID=UPI0037E7CFDF